MGYLETFKIFLVKTGFLKKLHRTVRCVNNCYMVGLENMIITSASQLIKTMLCKETKI